MSKLRTDNKFLMVKKAELSFGARISDILRFGYNRFLINLDKIGKLVCVDENLEILWERTYPRIESYVSNSVAVNVDGSRFSVSSLNRILILNEASEIVYRIDHNDWSGFNGSEIFFTKDGKYFICILPFFDEDHDVLQIRDQLSYAVLEEISIPLAYSFYSFYDFGRSDKLIVETANGQDDSYTFELTIDIGKSTLVECKEISDRVFGNLSPSKNKFITSPHYEDDIFIHDAKNYKILKRIREEDVFLFEEDEHEPDSFYFVAKLIEENRILILTRLNRLVAYDLDKNRISGELILNDKKTDDETRTIYFFGLKKDHLLFSFSNGTLATYVLDSTYFEPSPSQFTLF